MRSAALLTALLAGCGGQAPDNAVVTANQIERLSTPKLEKADPSATARLEPLSAADLELEGLRGARCGFTDDSRRLLLAANASDAIVRIQGELRHLAHSAPFGPTGGFFEDRQLSVSVGRTSESATAAEEASSWPARITVTNRRTEVQHEMQGFWTCGA